MAAGLGVFVEVLGIFSAAMEIFNFGQDNFGSKEEDFIGSTIKIAVALDGGALSGAGGDLPDVRLFNEFGVFLGIKSDPGVVETGEVGVIKVTHNNALKQQAPYTLFSANDNAICIAMASITWPDGNQWGWIGDWGRQCNGAWYFSNVFLQGMSRQPFCMWIDANGDMPHTGFQIHWPDFAPTVPPSLRAPEDTTGTPLTPDDLCNSGPPFELRTDSDPKDVLIALPRNQRSKRRQQAGQRVELPAEARIRRRAANSTASGERGAPWYRQQLVVDYSLERSARMLCESKSSQGPDFASYSERLFCRMSDKTLWKFCGGKRTADCYSPESQRLVVSGALGALSSEKYAKVVTWNKPAKTDG
ncbi:hypothetical protein QBC39DRAFT_301213 [Podospora conica]|nr:hypothetical protein QBC39DRAFT_301213 [Schizothecium conicum]